MNHSINVLVCIAGLFTLLVSQAISGEMIEIPGVIDDTPVDAPLPKKRIPEPALPRVTRATDKEKTKTPPLPPDKPAEAEVQEIIPMPPAVRNVRAPQPEIEPRRTPSTLERNSVRQPLPPATPPTPPHPSPAARQSPARMSLADTIATLDGEPISRLELYDAMVDTSGSTAFARIINRKLLRSEMRRRRLSISSQEIDATFAEHMKRLQAGQPRKIDLAKLLRYQYGVTIAEYKARIVWVELALRKLMRKNLSINDGDVFNYYYAHRNKYSRPAEVRASHILISPATYALRNKDGAVAAGSIAWNKAYRVALQVQAKLRAGADFKELAHQVSQDKRTASRGGDVGYFPRGRMLKPFEDAAFALKKGEVSDLVKTTLGYHLIKTTGQIHGKLLPFSEVKARVRKDYEKYMLTSQSSDMLERIRRTAIEQGRLKIMDPALRQGP